MLAGNPLALVRVGGAVLALPAGGALAAVLALPHPAVHPQAVVSVDLAVPALQHSCGTWRAAGASVPGHQVGAGPPVQTGDELAALVSIALAARALPARHALQSDHWAWPSRAAPPIRSSSLAASMTHYSYKVTRCISGGESISIVTEFHLFSFLSSAN